MPEQKKKLRRLKDINPYGVDLVGTPAIGERFTVVKQLNAPVEVGEDKGFTMVTKSDPAKPEPPQVPATDTKPVEQTETVGPGNPEPKSLDDLVAALQEETSKMTPEAKAALQQKLQAAGLVEAVSTSTPATPDPEAKPDAAAAAEGEEPVEAELLTEEAEQFFHNALTRELSTAQA